ncbi:MAG: glycosyltransferase family 4 protein, partial [Bacteroidetes bacterium]|nr:glycosyltransferase family 4 protein [Bacteroidota bacterium]
NILFINSIQMWGGGEVFLMDIMSGMKERGHNVHLLCRSETELAENALKLGFDVTTIRFGGDFDPIVIWKTKQLIEKNKINVVCTNLDKELRFGGIAAKLAGVKGIIPSREIDRPLKNILRYRFIYNFLATHLIVNSQATKNTVINSAPWLDENKISVIYKGISLEPFDNPPTSKLNEELGLNEKTKFITFVGQLEKRKGIKNLLDAWKSIHKNHTDAVLLIIGKGPMQGFIEDFINSNNLHSQVKLLGFRNDIPSILLQSYLLTLPSLYEGFGYVLVEAMAARIPTVATNVSSIPEIVEDKKTGLLVPIENSQKLAEAISYLLNHPDEAKKMGFLGRKVVEEKFTINLMIDKFEQVFLTAIENTP